MSPHLITPSTNIRLIVLDLGGVFFTRGKSAFFDLLATRLRIDPAHVAHALDGPHALQYRRGHVSADHYWKRASAILGVPLHPNTMETLWFCQYNVQPGICRLLGEIRQRHYAAYLSNNIPNRVTYLDRKYQFTNSFDGGLFSYDIGAVKSDGNMHHTLLRTFKPMEPEQVLLVDDKIENLKLPAQDGFHTLRFEGVKQLRASLTSYKIP